MAMGSYFLSNIFSRSRRSAFALASNLLASLQKMPLKLTKTTVTSVMLTVVQGTAEVEWASWEAVRIASGSLSWRQTAKAQTAAFTFASCVNLHEVTVPL